MDWLNYHHLYYFWVVAREGSIVSACTKLHVSQPTVSHQLRQLERAVGQKIFEKAGRGLKLTETGQIMFRYAQEIFHLGHELQDSLRGVATGSPLRLRIGVPDGVPKLMVYRLLKPLIEFEQPVRFVCREGPLERLLYQLASHELDLVLSDAPATGATSVRAFNHVLGQCGVTFFGTPEIVARYRPAFPESLADAPLLLPTPGTTLRRGLDLWFDQQGIRPQIVAEFDDSALLKVFGQVGLGLFPAPGAIVDEVEQQYKVLGVGTLDDVQERYYAISIERRLKHPAVTAISRAAKQGLLA